MPFESHDNSHVLEATVPAAAAAVAQDTIIGRVPMKGKVQGVAVTSEANVTAHATNNRTLRVINKGQDGNGTTVVASLALDTPTTDDLADFDEKTIPVTDANATVNSGDVLAFDETVGGSGLAHSGLRVAVQVVAE